MTTLLVVTLGQTDVQLVANGQRHKLDGNTCGTLHDAVKQRSWLVVEAPRDRSRRLIEVLPDGDLSLCTPKVDAILAHFGPSQPTSVLILETRRQDARDPRFAGEVIERRLRDHHVENVARVAFLTGDEQLEDPSSEVDAVVRRAVVARLSNAIGLATANLKREDLVFVATTGGLPAVNELISELVRLHCVGGPKVTALEVPDGDRAKLGDRAVEEKFHPAVGYSARWRALSLVERGNFLAAWGAVSHLEGAPGQEWTQVVKWLADFASSLPLSPKCELGTIVDTRMSVRAALRVELALRAGDVPRAIHGTVAFLEAALWDHLNERIVKHPAKKRQFKFKAPIDENLVRIPEGECELKSNTQRDKYRKRPFIYKNDSDGCKWYRLDNQEGCDRRLAKDYLGLEGISRLSEAVTTEIRELRNNVAHADPAPEQVDEAFTVMRNASLWSDSNTFLSQPLVQNVLVELGVSDPPSLCSQLLHDVRTRLLNPEV